MTNQNENPHQDYRRQTDQYYGRTVSAGLPQISRDTYSAPEPATEYFPVEPDPTEQYPVLPMSRFTAGTTYSGRGDAVDATPPPAPTQQHSVPIGIPITDSAATQQIPVESPDTPPYQQVMPVIAPSDATPTQQISLPPPIIPPEQQAMPVIAPPDATPTQQIPSAPVFPPLQQAMPVLPPPPVVQAAAPPPPPPITPQQPYWSTSPPPPLPQQHLGMPITTPASAQRFELLPSHAMWGLTVIAGLMTLASGLGWILVAAGCAYAAWYLGQRRAQWPPDVQDLLSRFGLAAVPATPRAQTAGAAAPIAYIPFRPMTFSEIFTAALKVVRRNWPILVGIPLALLLAAGLAGAALGWIMAQVMISNSDSLLRSGGFGSFFVLFGFFGLLVYAISLPLDALLIALGVITTDKAVRGEPIRMATVFALAKQRILPVTRLTLAFYSIFIVVDMLVYTIVIAAVMTSSLALGIFLYLLLLAANFALGIIFSLAPIVVVIEHRGVVDSFKRSKQLVKSAWGRILGIHLLWAVCVVPILMLPMFAISFILGPVGMLLFMIIGLSFMIAFTRTLQLLVYTDLRMRQEHYEYELIADWSRNTAIN